MQKITARYRTTGLNAAMFAIAALVLMVMVGMSYREWKQYSRANADAARTREIVDSVDTLLSSLISTCVPPPARRFLKCLLGCLS
ncbi:MAG: hypothetical protein ABSH52_35415 [Terriglobia bacterium]